MNQTAPLPVSRRDFVYSPLDADGRYVVKDPRRQTYFRLGPRERFLLDQLDGHRGRRAIQTAFRREFKDDLADDDLDGFLELAASRDLLETPQDPTLTAREAPAGAATAAPAPIAPKHRPSGQSLLAWRKGLFDPDRSYSLLEPRIRFFWSWGFLALSAATIAAACVVLGLNRLEFVTDLTGKLRWETVLLAAATLLFITALHESAHGLTCKHFGGEVHEVGFLLIFFIPAFFCNVSDAWLLPQKWKRLAITFAGGYFELFLWAIAVFVWRLTVEDTLINYLAWTVVSVSGMRVLFNFTPFIKLDGYYLLSDLLDVPNLRQRSLEAFAARLRWLLWGAAPPAAPAREGVLLCYGAACWCVSLFMLGAMLWALGSFLDRYLGLVAAIVLVAPLALGAARAMFQGFFRGEAIQMVRVRPARSLLWGAVVSATAAALTSIHVEERSKGDFLVDPTTRMQVRAPLAAFLKKVAGEEGTHVSQGQQVALLEVPDLESKIAGKQAEVRETEAQLKLLETGTREEELTDARERVERTTEWRDLAKSDLNRSRESFEDSLTRLDQKIVEAAVSLKQARETAVRWQQLLKSRVITEQQVHEARTNFNVAKAQLAQVRSEKSALESVGNLPAEQELAKREKELEEAKAALTLLEAGSRQEEIEAAEASLARQKEELAFLEEQREKLPLNSRVAGVITTPHLKDRIGEYFQQGDLICEVEEASSLEIEISVPEDSISKVKPGQCVDLKARAMPFETFEAKVERIAPSATSGEHQSTVVVYCRLTNEAGETKLRPEMTGHARIYCGKKPIGQIGLDHLLRLIRTEFWW